MEYYGSPFFNGDPIFPFNNYPNFSGAAMVETQQQMCVPQAKDKSTVDDEVNINGQEKKKKKKKMTNEQVKFLEKSFQEEIKLDPSRKMELARELGLHPRQVAVWFQNKKARWKNKQVEHLYESLRQEFDVVCKEKEMLQQELMKLKSMLNESGSSKMMQTWRRSCSQIETLENTSVQFRLN